MLCLFKFYILLLRDPSGDSEEYLLIEPLKS